MNQFPSLRILFCAFAPLREPLPIPVCCFALTLQIPPHPLAPLREPLPLSRSSFALNPGLEHRFRKTASPYRATVDPGSESDPLFTRNKLDLNHAHFRFVLWPVLLSPQALVERFHAATVLVKSGGTSPIARYHLSSAGALLISPRTPRCSAGRRASGARADSGDRTIARKCNRKLRVRTVPTRKIREKS